MLIDCTDKVLIDYIDNKLDSLDIVYSKRYHSQYNEDVILDYKPTDTAGFQVEYRVDEFKALHYINKLAKDFIANREYLERCLCLK